MKNSLTIVLCLTFCTFSFSQKNIEIGDYYEFSTSKSFLIAKAKENTNKLVREISIKEIENLSNEYTVNGDRESIESGRICKLVHTTNQFFIVEIYEESSTKSENGKGTKSKLLALTENEFRVYTRKYKGEKPRWGFVTSAVTLPVKVRFGDGNNDISEDTRYLNFEGNMNIGITAGIRRRISKDGKAYLSLLGAFNIGATKITAETTNNQVSEETNIAILTPMIGVLFEYEDFQIGAFTGWDHISGKLGRSWDYQGKTWLGLGIGYNIFTSKNKSTSQEDIALKKK